MSIGKLPQNYDDLKKALEKLFGEWREALKAKFGDNKFVEDGAFPGYCDQQLKILFVGWEAYGCEGFPDSKICPCEYKDNQSFKCADRKLMKYFLANKPDHKEKRPERPKIAQLAANITCKLLKLYGANKEQEIPYPECPKDMSLAFMDVSKFVNNKGSGLSPCFKDYVDESLGGKKKPFSRNFIREEIELLNPDLIISWNLRAKLGVNRFRKILTRDCKKNLENIEGMPKDVLPNRAWKYTFDDGREIPLFDTYHFSARLDAERCISEPVMKAFSSEVVKNLIEGKKAQNKKEQ